MQDLHGDIRPPAGKMKDEADYVITIEVCGRCSEHAWCTQHDEAKYQAIYEQVKAQLESHPEIKLKVLRNVHPINHDMLIKPRMGAFEIAHQGIIIYSKINSTLFPNANVINQRITKFFADKKSGSDLMKYSNSSEKKMQPPPKPRDKAAIYGSYYVAIQREQERQQRQTEEEEEHRIQQEREEEQKQANQLLVDEEAEKERILKEEEDERQRIEAEEQEKENELQRQKEQQEKEQQEEEEREKEKQRQAHEEELRNQLQAEHNKQHPVEQIKSHHADTDHHKQRQ